MIDNRIRQFDRISAGTFLVGTESRSFQLFDPDKERFTTLLDNHFLTRHKIPIKDGQLSADERHFWGLMPGIRLIDYDRLQRTIRLYAVPKLTGLVNVLHDFILTASGYLYGECQEWTRRKQEPGYGVQLII